MLENTSRIVSSSCPCLCWSLDVTCFAAFRSPEMLKYSENIRAELSIQSPPANSWCGLGVGKAVNTRHNWKIRIAYLLVATCIFLHHPIFCSSSFNTPILSRLVLNQTFISPVKIWSCDSLVKLFKLLGPLKVHWDYSIQYNGSDNTSCVSHLTTLSWDVCGRVWRGKYLNNWFLVLALS